VRFQVLTAASMMFRILHGSTSQKTILNRADCLYLNSIYTYETYVLNVMMLMKCEILMVVKMSLLLFCIEQCVNL
jgi:hypothetical protein